MKKVPSVIAIMVLFFSCLQAQERIVKVDFESGSFYNNPRIPFDNPFVVMGEAGKEIRIRESKYFLRRKKLHSAFLCMEQGRTKHIGVIQYCCASYFEIQHKI